MKNKSLQKSQRPPKPLKTLYMLTLLFLLNACLSTAQPPAPPLYKSAVIEIITQPDTNLAYGGQSVPIEISVYELTTTSTFVSSAYLELATDAAATLESELVERHRVTLPPNSQHTLQLTLQPATRVLGVTAGYSEIGSKLWRATVGITEPGETSISVAATKDGLTVLP